MVIKIIYLYIYVTKSLILNSQCKFLLFFQQYIMHWSARFCSFFFARNDDEMYALTKSKWKPPINIDNIEYKKTHKLIWRCFIQSKYYSHVVYIMELILARVFIRIITFKQRVCSADILQFYAISIYDYMTLNLCLRCLFVFIGVLSIKKIYWIVIQVSK